MRKVVVSMMVALMLLSSVASAAPAQKRGGFIGFIGGCCVGLRAGASYNDGKELHVREWLRLVPLVSLVVGIWDGIDCYGGKTTADLRAEYGEMYY